MAGILCIQFDHRRLISAGLDRVIRLWDIRSGRSLHKFYGHKVLKHKDHTNHHKVILFLVDS